MIEGKAVYDEEIVKLVAQLKAKGLLLVVINGYKNKSDIEFGSALTFEDIPRVCNVLRSIADEFQRDWLNIAIREAKKN